MGHCWRSKDKLINDLLLWIPAGGRTERTFLHQLSANAGCNLEGLPVAIMIGMDVKRESRKSMLSLRPDDDDDDDDNATL